jgi:hypothetical protein
VSNAGETCQLVGLNMSFKLSDTFSASHTPQAAVLKNCHAARVVASIFKAF